MIVVRHPVPIRFAPRRGKHERMGYLRVDTPVRLRDLGARDFEDVIRWGRPGGESRALVGMDGEVWVRGGMSTADGPWSVGPDERAVGE